MIKAKPIFMIIIPVVSRSFITPSSLIHSFVFRSVQFCVIILTESCSQGVLSAVISQVFESGYLVKLYCFLYLASTHASIATAACY